MKPYVVALTGASGAIYGLRLIQILTERNYPVEIVVSEAARLVIREEIGPDYSFKNLTLYSPKDFTAPIASGSYPVEAMIVVPCSMGTLGAVASGISQNLIHRAADCMIKEGRKLIRVPRETPLIVIHLENMLKLSRLGVSIVPAMPGFYAGASTIQELIDFMIGKILDQLGIDHTLYPRWTGLLRNAK